MQDQDKAYQKLLLSTNNCWLGREIVLDYLFIFSSDEEFDNGNTLEEIFGYAKRKAVKKQILKNQKSTKHKTSNLKNQPTPHKNNKQKGERKIPAQQAYKPV